MKMVMMIIDDKKREELEVFLGRAGVTGYTELSGAAGKGASGLRLGSRAFPLTSSVVFSMLEQGALDQLIRDADEFCSTCGEQLHMFAWDVEQIR